MAVDSSNHSVASIKNGRLISGDRVCVCPSSAIAGPALLVLFPDTPLQRKIPVDVQPNEAIPANVLAMSADLVHSCGLDLSIRTTWRLETTGFSRTQAAELTLEAPVTGQLDKLVVQINSSEQLSGKLLYLPRGTPAPSHVVQIDDVPYRIHHLAPLKTSEDTIFEVTPATHVSLFSPSYRTDVDVVILADCSGSMGFPDVTNLSSPVPSLPPPPPVQSSRFSLLDIFKAQPKANPPAWNTIPRYRVLQESLRNLFKIRLEKHSAGSRMALVAFDEICDVRWPVRRGGGMAEIDPANGFEIDAIQTAINGLTPNQRGTKIGPALQYAAQLLHHYGNPEHERLIVLISDGADWAPQGTEAIGEMLASAIEEPISLMQRLRETMNIRLHAIGISNVDLFHRYCQASGISAETPGARPNHGLLQELMRVGGGEQALTGDTQVLHSYLEGLGEGVQRSLQLRVRKGNPSPTLEELQQISELQYIRLPNSGGMAPPELIELRKSIRDKLIDSNEITKKTLSAKLFDYKPYDYDSLLDAMEQEVVSERTFELYIVTLHRFFWDCSRVDDIKSRLGVPRPGIAVWHTAVSAIKKLCNGRYYPAISPLRHRYAHGNTSRSKRASMNFPSPEQSDRAYADALSALIKKPFLLKSDAKGWSELQLASCDS